MAQSRKRLPEGTDPDQLTRKFDLDELAFEYKGQRWMFSYERVTWADHWQAVEDAWEASESGPVFNATAYYTNLLLKSVKVLAGRPLTEEWLAELDTEVTAKLSSVIPSPLLDREVEAVKKGPRLTPSSETSVDATDQRSGGS